MRLLRKVNAWMVVALATTALVASYATTVSTKRNVAETEWDKKRQLVSTLLYKEAELGRYDIRGLKQQLVVLERIPRVKWPPFYSAFHARTLKDYRYQARAYNGKLREYEEARMKLNVAFPKLEPIKIPVPTP